MSWIDKHEKELGKKIHKESVEGILESNSSGKGLMWQLANPDKIKLLKSTMTKQDLEGYIKHLEETIIKRKDARKSKDTEHVTETD